MFFKAYLNYWEKKHTAQNELLYLPYAIKWTHLSMIRGQQGRFWKEENRTSQITWT